MCRSHLGLVYLPQKQYSNLAPCACLCYDRKRKILKMGLARLAIEIFLDMLAFWRCRYLLKRSCLQLFFKIGILKNFPNFKEKQQPFFNKVSDLGAATLLKRVCNISAFLWNLRNFEEHVSLQISPGNCFYLLLPIHFCSHQ